MVLGGDLRSQRFLTASWENLCSLLPRPQIDSCHTLRLKEKRFPRQQQGIPTRTIFNTETRIHLGSDALPPPQSRLPLLPCLYPIPKRPLTAAERWEEVFAVRFKAPGDPGPKQDRWLDSVNPYGWGGTVKARGPLGRI